VSLSKCRTDRKLVSVQEDVAMTFDAQWWEQHYADQPAGGAAPSPHLVTELTGLPTGAALDAGCGTGGDAVWLAQQGWDVTAVDVSSTAIEQAKRLAADQAPDVAERITWLVADLLAWEPPQQYDLVVSQYVHPGVPFADFVARLAQAVAVGGTLFVAGHDHTDSHSAEHAPESAAIEPDAVADVLSADEWDVVLAESRTRQAVHDGTETTLRDVVVKAHRKLRR
jgi:2-polyprenyl-3-methyl-5-hydroxy-6-metoxy-1,4-benzoquinol methylase